MMNDPRKRPFPFPSLLETKQEANHKRRHSQSSEGSAVSQEFTAKMIACRLCNNRSFKTEDDFDLHLTMIHYRDQLSDRLGMPPYSCGLCSFRPTADDPNEEMILHYGCKERLALKFYEEECKRLPSPSKVAKKSTEAVKDFQRNTILCQLCNTRLTNDQLFQLHLTNKHFSEDLKKKLPQNPPFKCPMIGCEKIKTDRQTLLMHYGVDHNMSQNLYQKATSKSKVKEIDMFKSNTTQMITCKMCKDKKTTFVTAKSLKIHLTQTHFFPYIGSGSTKIKCPKCARPFPSRTDFTKHFVESHFEKYVKEKEFEKKTSSDKKSQSCLSLQKSLAEEVDAKPLPKSRERKTVHGPAKERQTVHGSNETKASFPQTQSKLSVNKEDVSKPGAGGARQRMLDKWKSTSIDSQKFELEKLHEEIGQMKVDHQTVLKNKAQDFERWISQKEKAIEEEVQKRQGVEKKLETAQVNLADMEKQLEQKDSKISSLEEVVVEEHSKYSQVMKEKSELEKKLTTQDVLGKELCEFQGYIDKMKAESKDLKAQLTMKSDELSEQQELNEKMKNEHEKQLAKLNKQLETWKSKHEKVLEEKKEKMAHIKEITKLHKELENDQKNQLSRLNQENDELKRECENASQVEKELTESKLSKKVKALEAEKKDNDSTVKLLESQRNALLDSLDRLQKIMQGFESVIKDKNEKIQDVSTKLEEAEINLEEALQKINTFKSEEKDRKESQKTIKQLQGSLQDYESRQFTNTKLISGLQQQKQILEKRIKDYEERDEVKKIERELKGVKSNNDKQEQEIAKQQALLRSKTNELYEMSDKLTAARNRIKDLEKEVRRDQSLNPSSEEHEDLRHTVSTLSTRYNRLKEEFQKLEVSSRTSGSGDVKKWQDQVETLKRVARDSQSKLNRKEKEVERLRLLLNEVSNHPADNTPVQIKKEPIEVDGETPLILHTDDAVVTMEDPDPILVNSADSTVGVSHYDYNDPYDLPVDVDGTDSMTSNGSPSSAPLKATSAKKRKSSSKIIEDVTNKYNEEEDDIVCGICEGYDPPLPAENSDKKATYTTSWVGCDCGTWYHKQCTNLKRFTAAFSCKSVKRKCQKKQGPPPLIPMTIVSSLPPGSEEDSETILS